MPPSIQSRADNTMRSSVYIMDIEGSYITKPEKNYKQVSAKEVEVIHHNNNWQYEERVANLCKYAHELHMN